MSGREKTLGELIDRGDIGGAAGDLVPVWRADCEEELRKGQNDGYDRYIQKVSTIVALQGMKSRDFPPVNQIQAQNDVEPQIRQHRHEAVLQYAPDEIDECAVPDQGESDREE